MQKWEYLRISFALEKVKKERMWVCRAWQNNVRVTGIPHDAEIDALLVSFGEQGWELITVVTSITYNEVNMYSAGSYTNAYTYIFKRPKT